MAEDVMVLVSANAARAFKLRLCGIAAGYKVERSPSCPPRVRPEVWQKLVRAEGPVTLTVDEWVQCGVHHPWASDAIGYQAQVDIWDVTR